MSKLPQAQIGIFGGSGFYSLLANGKRHEIKTPFGKPSGKIFIGEYAGKKIAFLPRHGSRHQFPPHRIPYRANLYAFKMLGVKTIIAPAAVGSLQARIKPGDFVICNQFFNRTHGRADTFFEGKTTKNKFSQAKVVHISSAEPYCENLRKIAFDTCRKLKIKARKNGTVVVINGPRFSSRSESQYFSRQNFDVINMTQYPECILAKELEICYLGIALVTDYDAGLQGRPEIKPVSVAEITRVFENNNKRVKRLIFKIIERISADRNCVCHESLREAVVS